MDRAREKFQDAGADLVLIGQATPRHAAHFRRRLKLSLPVLADEQRVSYQAIGAKMGSMGDLLGPKVVAKGALTTLRTGMLQTRTIGNTAQLGGAVVVRPDGTLAFEQLADDAGDNVPPDELLAAVRAA